MTHDSGWYATYFPELKILTAGTRSGRASAPFDKPFDFSLLLHSDEP